MQDLRDTLAKNCFIEALNDAELKMLLCQKEPESLEDAVRVALKYEAFSHSRCKRLTSAKSSVRMQHESNDENMIRRDDIREIIAALAEIKQSNRPQFTQNQSNKEGRRCYNCNDNTPMKRNCHFNVFSNSRNNHICPPLLGNSTRIRVVK